MKLGGDLAGRTMKNERDNISLEVRNSRLGFIKDFVNLNVVINNLFWWTKYQNSTFS